MHKWSQNQSGVQNETETKAAFCNTSYDLTGVKVICRNCPMNTWKMNGNSEPERAHKRCWFLLDLRLQSCQFPLHWQLKVQLTPRPFKPHRFLNSNSELYSSGRKVIVIDYGEKNYMQVGCHNSRIWLHLAQEAEGVKTLMLTHYPDG